MKEIEILSHYSPWVVFLCVFVGIGYAYFLYQKPTVWTKNTNRFLAILRFLLVSILCVLLMGVFLNMVKKQYEKPIYAFLVDNSQSITFLKDSTFKQKITQNLKNIESQLLENNYQIDIYDLDSKKESFQEIDYTQTSTNLGKTLKQLSSDYENQNLAGVILLSDGICNQGILPIYQSYSFPIHTIGVGDTTVRQDLQIANLFYNKVSYLNNQFSIVAEIRNKEYQGKSTQVILKQNDTIIGKQQLNFYQQEGTQKVQFLVQATKLGKIRYQIEIKPLDKELTISNNTKSAYVDIIQQKEKILLLANSPHPDLKMFKSIIQTQEKYELDIVILNNQKSYEWKKNQPYSLVILHEIPTISQKHKSLVEKIQQSDISLLYIVGKQSDLRSFNKGNGLVTIQQNLPQFDEVHGVGNDNFDKFEFSIEKWIDFANAPPLQVPFAEYQIKKNAEVLLYQQLGSIKTTKPLCLYGENNDQKIGVIVGEGLWKWRMFEHLNTNKIVVFDEFFKKYLQLLTVKKDKRKFVVEPKVEEIFETENISFSIHCYNDIYEEIFNKNVTIKVYNEQGKMSEFHFTTNNLNDNYQLSQLKEGLYRYVASTKIGDETLKVNGGFVIKSMQLEELNLLANFDLLNKLSERTKGEFSFLEGKDQNIIKNILKQQPQELIHSTEQELEIIHFQWICYLLIFLVSIEWTIRKFMGSY